MHLTRCIIGCHLFPHWRGVMKTDLLPRWCECADFGTGRRTHSVNKTTSPSITAGATSVAHDFKDDRQLISLEIICRLLIQMSVIITSEGASGREKKHKITIIVTLMSQIHTNCLKIKHQPKVLQINHISVEATKRARGLGWVMHTHTRFRVSKTR